MKAINKKIITLFVVIFAIFASVKSEIQEEEHVLVLTDSNFEEAIKANRLLLVEFYAPWCGHCKALAPNYSKAAEVLKEKGSEIRLAKVDATQENALAQKYEIRGFPTLRYFIDGKDIEYTGGRSTDDIVSWVEKKSGPATKKLNSLEELNAMVEEENAFVVFFGKQEGESYEMFNKAATSNDSFSFVTLEAEGAAKAHGCNDGDVVLFKKYDDRKNVYTGEKSADSLNSFIEDSAFPLVSGFDEKSAEFLFGKAKTAVFLYRDPTKQSNLDEVLRELAPKYKGKIYMVASGITGELEEKLAEYIGVTESHLPVVKIHQVGESDIKKFTMTGEINKTNVEKFVEDYLEKKLTAEYKSEEVTEQDPNSSVFKIVGKNFDEIVKDSTKDVLVEFYAPWCGHCKALEPKYENLAAKLKGVKSLLIAKMDATANEHPDVEIEGFPTLKFYSGKNKNPIDFEGSRSEHGILEFLKSQDLLEKIPDDIVFEAEPEEEEGEGEEEGEEGEEEEGGEGEEVEEKNDL